MRKAKELDYWTKVYKRQYQNCLKSINLNGLNGMYEILFSEGITAICGLNGAGKSTIIAAIKAALGLELSDTDLHKLKGMSVEGVLKLNGDFVTISSNTECEYILNDDFSSEKITFLDCDECGKIQEFNVKQTNLDELIEQNEEYIFSTEEVTNICYLIGKQYNECKIWEFEDIEGIGTVPYFKVVVDGTEYDSRSMGTGEHFLFYLFWRINKCESDTIVIIEEPETYISIYSQMCFSNYIGMQIANKGIQVILTTHSPYLLEHIKNDNIRIVSRMGNFVTVTSPCANMMADDILGVRPNYSGTLFVEDRVACDFLSVILEDKAPYILKKYTIDILDGEDAISKQLKMPKSDKIKYNFIGIYDGDMRDRLNVDSLCWNYFFLPGDKPLEEIYRCFLHDHNNLRRFCEASSKTRDEVVPILAIIDGYDYHDWFEELRKMLNIDRKLLISTFYEIIESMNEEIDTFIADLNRCIN